MRVTPQSPCPVEDFEGQDSAATVASLKQYLWSIIYMPSALRSVEVTVIIRPH